MRIVIVGGGLIGLGLAGQLGRDHDVVLLEKGECGGEASRAAAGMLGPVMEVEFDEPELLQLNKQSHALYPEFVERLEEETGVPTGFRTEGTFFVAVDPPQKEDLERLFEYQTRLGLEVEHTSLEEAREREPRLSTYVSSTIYGGSDYQIDNRALIDALVKRCRLRGVELREGEPAESVHVEEGAVVWVRTDRDRYRGDLFVIAAGAWSGRLEGLPGADQMPVRPVKGQALSVQLSDPPEVQHVIRSPEVYCVPKPDGRMVIGATMEEEGYDRQVTAGGMLDLLHGAYEILPFIYEQPLLETWAGLRPASRDSLPIVGPSAVTENLVFATGHYRNGVLLTPITIKLIEQWLEEGRLPDLIDPFLPKRFQGESDAGADHSQR